LFFGGEFSVASHAAVCSAPADYGELFLEYGGDIRRLVRAKLGPVAQPGDVDDGVQYIFQQFIANDVLTQYKPGTISDYTGRPVSFKAFVMAKVPLYCRGLRETLGRRLGRELQVLDSPESESAYAASDLGSTCDQYPSLDGMDLDRLREALAQRENTPGRAPVLPLFDALAARSAEGKRVSLAAVRAQFGLDREGVDIWFGELRDALREVTGRGPAPEPVAQAEPAVPELPDEAPEVTAWFTELRVAVDGGFALGGLVLTAGEVRAAAEALRACQGNQVLRAFKVAGHRLAGAGKFWYLDFAEQVMTARPELRTAPQRHADGHFGRVKQALIAGLDALVAGVPADNFDPVAVPVSGPVGEPVTAPALTGAEAARWAELERVIAGLPGFDSDRVDVALETVRLLSLEPAWR
jgi:hypothetical protein